jgi:hypothetical protein
VVVEEDADPAPTWAGGGGVEPATGATGGFPLAYTIL